MPAATAPNCFIYSLTFHSGCSCCLRSQASFTILAAESLAIPFIPLIIQSFTSKFCCDIVILLSVIRTTAVLNWRYLVQIVMNGYDESVYSDFQATMANGKGRFVRPTLKLTCGLRLAEERQLERPVSHSPASRACEPQYASEQRIEGHCASPNERIPLVTVESISQCERDHESNSHPPAPFL